MTTTATFHFLSIQKIYTALKMLPEISKSTTGDFFIELLLKNSAGLTSLVPVWFTANETEGDWELREGQNLVIIAKER